MDDSFYKIMSEALLVLTLIVKTIRPLGVCVCVCQCVCVCIRECICIYMSASVYCTYTCVCQCVCVPLPPPFPDPPCSFDFQPYTQPIYSSALKRLRAADIDQEVKERAITCM